MDFYLTALIQGLCFAGIAFGIYISMKIFNIPDITTDGSYTLGGVVTGIMLTQHQPDFGTALPATGNSEQMNRAFGVNTDRMKIIGLAIANALTALSCYLIAQQQGFADINMGIGIVIVGLGSVIIAETIINWLQITSVWLSLVLVLSGAIIFQFVLAITLNLGINPNLLKAVTAAFVLSIVILPRLSL